MTTTTTPEQLSLALTAEGFPLSSPQFLTSILSNPRSPLASLLATAKHRLLASDMTSSSILAASTASFPHDICAPEIPERKLAAAVPVQVVGVEDLSRSRWDQIEAIEARERGEGTRGREIVRVVAEVEDGAGAGEGGSKGGVHRLVVQDVKGLRVYALELKPLREVGLGMSIGMKMIFKQGTIIARGLVLLEPGTVVVLGGKIEALHKAWVENRKKDLEAAIEVAGLGQAT